MQWVVIMERDGKKPSTKYYNRLRALGLYVNRDQKDPNGVRNPNPQQRRAVSDGMVVVQEGCVICATEDTARKVAMYANEDGCTNVKVGRIETEDFYANTEDVKIHQRIEALAGKRGRRGIEEPDQEWDVLCYNEIGVYTEPESRYVLNCPHCGGMKIKAFPKGKITRYQMPDDDPNEPFVQRWLRAAFGNGEFVPVAVNGETPPATPRVPTNGEGKTCDVIKRSPELSEEKLGKLDMFTAAHVLDAVFIARREIARDTRINNRVAACVKLLSGKADPAKVPVAEDDNVYDVLDAASIIGVDQAAGIWLAVNR